VPHLTEQTYLPARNPPASSFSQAKMEKAKQQHMYFMFLTPHLVNIPWSSPRFLCFFMPERRADNRTLQVTDSRGVFCRSSTPPTRAISAGS